MQNASKTSQLCGKSKTMSNTTPCTTTDPTAASALAECMPFILREVAMLHGEDTSSTAQRENIAKKVLHEMEKLPTMVASGVTAEHVFLIYNYVVSQQRVAALEALRKLMNQNFLAAASLRELIEVITNGADIAHVTDAAAKELCTEQQSLCKPLWNNQPPSESSIETTSTGQKMFNMSGYKFAHTYQCADQPVRVALNCDRVYLRKFALQYLEQHQLEYLQHCYCVLRNGVYHYSMLGRVPAIGVVQRFTNLLLKEVQRLLPIGAAER